MKKNGDLYERCSRVGIFQVNEVIMLWSLGMGENYNVNNLFQHLRNICYTCTRFRVKENQPFLFFCNFVFLCVRYSEVFALCK